MEAAILMGLQGAGKSTFCRERFFDTHVRLNLDMLRTRRWEKILLDACLSAGQRFVIDNTNPTRGDRRRYIRPAKDHDFSVVGYHFVSSVEACQARNEQRPAKQVVPLRGLRATHAKLQPPRPEEGFDALWYVSIAADGHFVVEPWDDQ